MISNAYRLANSEDPDEIPQDGSALFAKRKIFRERNSIYLKITTFDPSIYTIDPSKIIFVAFLGINQFRRVGLGFVLVL